MLISIILVSLCSGYVASCRSSAPVPEPVTPKPIPAPRIKNTTLEYPNNFKVTWDGIPEAEVQKEYPILGYTVSLWVDNRLKYNNKIDSTRGPGYEYPLRVVSKIPETEPVTVTVGPEVRSTNFTIEPQIAYQVRVMAFTNAAKGPYSFPETFKLLLSADDH